MSSDGVSLREAVDADIEALTDIQNALLQRTTFEWTETPHAPDERRRWLAGQRQRGFPVLVAEVAGETVGWASYGEFRDSTKWPGNRFTVEHTLHVHEAHWGRGIGRALLQELLERARGAGMHVMVAAVDGENSMSVRFHERMGFEEVGRLREIGAKHGRWLDLVLLQKLLDDAARPPPGRQGQP